MQWPTCHSLVVLSVAREGEYLHITASVGEVPFPLAFPGKPSVLFFIKNRFCVVKVCCRLSHQLFSTNINYKSTFAK